MTCHADPLLRRNLFTPNAGSLVRINSFWHTVQRWATKCFSRTPIGILAIESCLPPLPLLLSQRQRLAALQTGCAPPGVNPEPACQERSFPSQSWHWVPNYSRAHTRGLSSVHLPQSRRTLRHWPPFRHPLTLDALAHRPIGFTEGLSKVTMSNTHLLPKSQPTSSRNP